MKENINREYRMQCAQLVGEISALAFMVNTFTEYCVFIDFSGHVHHIKVSIRASEENYAECVTEDQVSTNGERWGEEKENIQNLTTLKFQLRKILLQKKIKYEGLNYTVREERDYQLI